MCLIMMFSCFAGCQPTVSGAVKTEPFPTVGMALPGGMFSPLEGYFKR